MCPTFHVCVSCLGRKCFDGVRVLLRCTKIPFRSVTVYRSMKSRKNMRERSIASTEPCPKIRVCIT